MSRAVTSLEISSFAPRRKPAFAWGLTRNYNKLPSGLL